MRSSHKILIAATVAACSAGGASQLDDVPGAGGSTVTGLGSGGASSV